MGFVGELGRQVAEERIRLAAERGHAPVRIGPTPEDKRFGVVCSCGFEHYRGDGSHKVGKLTRGYAVGQLVAHLLEVTEDQARSISQKHADAVVEKLVGNSEESVSRPNIVGGVV